MLTKDMSFLRFTLDDIKDLDVRYVVKTLGKDLLSNNKSYKLKIKGAECSELNYMNMNFYFKFKKS